jgi:hypothetical protein
LKCSKCISAIFVEINVLLSDFKRYFTGLGF